MSHGLNFYSLSYLSSSKSYVPNSHHHHHPSLHLSLSFYLSFLVCLSLSIFSFLSIRLKNAVSLLLFPTAATAMPRLRPPSRLPWQETSATSAQCSASSWSSWPTKLLIGSATSASWSSPLVRRLNAIVIACCSHANYEGQGLTKVYQWFLP